MKCQVLHESTGRIRVHIMQKRMTLNQADMLEYYLKSIDGITHVKVYDRTGDAIIRYVKTRQDVISALAAFPYENPDMQKLVPEQTSRALNRQFENKLAFIVLKRAAIRFLLPPPIRAITTIIQSIPYIAKGFRSLFAGKIKVALLDATAVTVSILRGDYKTASSVMFLLQIGETLEAWTYKKSVGDLARSLSLNVEKAWLKTEDTEKLVNINDIRVGDCIVVRTGSMIPLDGKVISGEATVNQASITGESLPVWKESGSYAYAGTVLEEGECVISVDKDSGSGRYDRIVRMLEESEKLKSSLEEHASHLADNLVPYSFAGTILTYLLTRDVTRAISILMVDFSCALKLAMPIAVLSAMRESSQYEITVKGGRFLEAVADAHTIVFDKTGTLTHASPTVSKIIPFDHQDEREMLKLAACLEEHYPHSIANAVVAEAQKQNLKHEECHSKVEYVVAHGISSMVGDQKVIIGSHHFVFQDEGCVIPDEERSKFESLPTEYSHLYMAISGRLAAVICIEDPLRDEANAVISSLHKLGITKLVMMTGDNEKTASAVAKAVGVDEYYAEVLPEDKANFVKKERAAGHKVIMIGDGVNDSLALSEADVGIAISDGAAIAREVADITLSADDLFSLITLKSLSDALMRRIHNNYNGIIGFNLLLIILGVAGILPPATSALLHNTSTLAISLYSMSNLLD